jgi:hypothetical protein
MRDEDDEHHCDLTGGAVLDKNLGGATAAAVAPVLTGNTGTL